jgi:putative aminophosphonate oxidoreductase
VPRSLWLEEALAQDDAHEEILQEQTRADVCIVGGGYTGLWTAIRLKELEPAADVVLVEADICGAGPSGRNGGFALSWWPKIETLVERLGDAEALRLARVAEAAVTELEEFCMREGIDAHFRRGGWLWTATSAAQVGGWNGAVQTAARLGAEPFRVVAAEELRDRTGSPVHLAGLFDAQAATIHAGFLARGLRRAALARGVRIYEHSPMVGLERDSGIVRTPSGSVEAEAVVLALNAWALQVRELRRAIVAVSSDMVATAAIPGQLEESGWTNGECVSNSRLMVHYYRTTKDGRVAFGRGGGRLAFGARVNVNFDFNRRQTRELTEELPQLVPAAAGVPITHAWGGPIDRSRDGLPIFGRLPARRRVVYATGFSGNGVAPSLTAGKILASSALGRDDEWSGCGLNGGVPARFPPEPVRFLGGLVVREAVRRKESREDVGKGVDPLTRRVAALAPSGFFRVSREGDYRAPGFAQKTNR